MTDPAVYADFNNADPAGRLRLNLRGTTDDLNRLSIELREGLGLTFSDGELWGRGVVRFSSEEQTWVAEINWGDIVDGEQSGMAAFRCPKHGFQIALHFCEHAAARVGSQSPVEVYLQKDEWGWYAVCPNCIMLPQSKHDANHLVCSRCCDEWVDMTGSDFRARCQNPTEERPGWRETGPAEDPA